jgi:hypothetical protein
MREVVKDAVPGRRRGMPEVIKDPAPAAAAAC